MLSLLKKLALLGLVLALAGCATQAHIHDEHHDEDHDEHHHTQGGRLLVHTDDGSIHIFDTASGEVVQIFLNVLEAGRAFTNVNSSGEYGFVTHRTNWQTVVVDSGYHLEEHGDHYDVHLHEPKLLGSLVTGLKPSHYFSNSGRSVFYNDDSGTVSVLEESQLRQSLEQRLIKARVDHGAPVLAASDLVIGYLNSSDIEVRSLDGTILQTLQGGTRLHGDGRLGRFIAFGLVEGVAILEKKSGSYQIAVLPKPVEFAENRINWLRSHLLSPHFIGRTDKGNFLASIDPVSKAWQYTRVPAAFTQFGFDVSGEHFAVLGSDGILYEYDPQTLALRASLQVLTPNTDLPPAVLVAANGEVWISDPQNSALLLVNLDSMEIETRLQVVGPGKISSFSLMQTVGVEH